MKMIGNDVVDLVLAEKKVIGDELDIYKKDFHGKRTTFNCK
jgi:hypothetical protein